MFINNYLTSYNIIENTKILHQVVLLKYTLNTIDYLLRGCCNVT